MKDYSVHDLDLKSEISILNTIGIYSHVKDSRFLVHKHIPASSFGGLLVLVRPYKLIQNLSGENPATVEQI